MSPLLPSTPRTTRSAFWLPLLFAIAATSACGEPCANPTSCDPLIANSTSHDSTTSSVDAPGVASMAHTGPAHTGPAHTGPAHTNTAGTNTASLVNTDSNAPSGSSATPTGPTPTADPTVPAPTPTDAPLGSDSAASTEAAADGPSDTGGPFLWETQPNETSQPTTDEDTATAADSVTQQPDETFTSDEVPATAHCASAAAWEAAWSQWEADVLRLVNEVRASGANCDTQGSFAPAAPLAMDAMLRCSSRLHSADMHVRDFFDHTNPDGVDPFERMEDAGFDGGWMGENIAYGQPSPEAVMQAWVESDGHCANIMNPNFTLIGVGYYPGGADWREGQHFWTQNFGAPLN